MNIVATKVLSSGKRCIQLLSMILLLLVLLHGRAHAAANAQKCEIFAIGENGLAASAHRAMIERKDIAARICTNGRGDLETYQSASPIWRGRLGACEFFLAPPDAEAARSGAVYMYFPRADCPHQNDRRYIGTSKVSEGIVLSIVTFWDEISSSSKTVFLDAFSKAGQIDKGLLEVFASQVFSGGGDRPEILSIELVSIPPNRYDFGYQALLKNTANPSKFWLIRFDMMAGQPEVIGFQSVEL